jgi:hypothetical protein
LIRNWATLGDLVIGLRVWGTNVEHDFPQRFLERFVDRVVIGKEPTTNPDAEPCIRLDHETVSRRHATIEWRGPHLVVVDQGSKNGTRSEGNPQGIFQILAGAVVSFGSVDTVAYSARTQKIRAGFRRFLGYGPAAQGDVERIQHVAMQRQHIALVGPPGCGAYALARFLHDTAPTSTWPHVVPDTIPAGDVGAQRALVAKAAYGTLVLYAGDRAVRAEKLSRLFDAIATNAYHVRLVVIAAPGTTLEHIVGEQVRSLLNVITLPPLEARRGELQVLLPETIAHHCAQHGATSDMLSGVDLATLEALAIGKGRVRLAGHDELEEVVGRLVVVRKHDNASEAEREIGFKSRGALSKWAAKYGFTLKQPGRPKGR